MSTDVFTVDEVASKLRVGRAAAYRLVDSGELRSVRVGRTIRVPAQALDDFLGGDPAESEPVTVKLHEVVT